MTPENPVLYVEKPLTIIYQGEEAVRYLVDFFQDGKDKKQNSISNKVYRKFLGQGKDEITVATDIDIGKQDKLKDEIKTIKKDIKELKQKADSEQLEDFNNNLTMSYLDVELKGISFINEDLVRNKFYLEFIPGKQEIAVWHNEIVTSKDGSEQSIKVSFDPGSLARHLIMEKRGTFEEVRANSIRQYKTVNFAGEFH